MGYRLKRERSVSNEVKRIADQQLVRAIGELRKVGDRRSDDAIHEARRHVKKVRALFRLVQPALGKAYVGLNDRMRSANRALAPIADGQAVVDTIGRLKRRYPARLALRTVSSLRSALVERAARIDRKAELDRVLPHVAMVLRFQREHLADLSLKARGFDAIEAGLDKSFRRARKAMRRARDCPGPDHYHSLRRRVKDLWFQIRLIERRCGNGLLADQRRLEALDGCLGEYHNIVLLEDILIADALVSRQQTARCLRLLRRYQRVLRRSALRLGGHIFREKPRHFVRRIERLWHQSAHPTRRQRRWSWREAA